MLASFYRILTDLGAPAISLYLLKRRAEGREDKARFRERLGYTSRTRPAGRLIWCHAASVGEAASLLTLIDQLRSTYPNVTILITTGTVTSARMLEKRLPAEVIHQYVPVDRAPYVRRFLAHWRPDLALWVESELWPNTLRALRHNLIPAVLLNGRMSAKSFRNWRRFRGWARYILSAFDVCLVQSDEARVRYAALGARSIRSIGNLKYAVKPLPVDEAVLDKLRAEIGNRPLWGMMSTHRGEEAIAIATHHQLRTKWPELLTVIVPRHAVRGDEVVQRLTEANIPFARRSSGDFITSKTEVYLADTMGELGLFYRLCPISVLGGSFVAIGGHNPVEAAQIGTAILFGPAMFNFAAIAREFVTKKAALQIKHNNELTPTLDRLLKDTTERKMLNTEARHLAEQKRHVLDEIMTALKPWLEPKTETGPGVR
jgi:3-deoxy-D-manno-octulosonic-acid transferase